MKVQCVTPEVPTDIEALLGFPTSPLDRRLELTTFANPGAKERDQAGLTLREIAERVHAPSAATKARLPLLKLARFGDVRTDKGSLRHNANVLEIEGIEGDHDAGTLSVEAAAQRLRDAGIAGLIYSSPSHTPDAPRWRVLCPLSRPMAPEDRERLCARLNGVLGGALASESFTLSQSYYFGTVDGAAAPVAELVDGSALDESDSLDGGALGKDGNSYSPTPEPPAAAASDDDDDWDFMRVPDWERIESALAAIPVEVADAKDGRETYWRPIGAALHKETSGSEAGFAAWTAWSQSGEKFNARDQRKVWDSFGRSTGKLNTIATLYHLAAQHGWNPKTGKMREPSRLRFLAPDDCAAAPSRGYIVKGLLAPGDVGCIYGAPGAGKSLISPHIGYQVARGELAFGMRTKQGSVFYVAAEDPHGMRGRVTALKLRHGDAGAFALVEGVSDLLAKDSEDLAALRSAVEERRPALIFLDTLAMSFPGLEENTAEDMGRVVAIARSLTEFGAAVVLIHHDTKAQSPTPRGHSLLNGALDIAIQLFPKDESGIVRGKLTKNRNGTCDRDIAFRIAAETLGEDEDGDLITAALVDELTNPPPRRERLSASQAAALSALIALRGFDDRRVTEDQWREACIEGRRVSASEDRASRRKAMDRAFVELVRKGLVHVEDGFVSPLVAGDGKPLPPSYGNAFDEEIGA